ncbi:LysR family transcriptional regulator [Microbacterium sp. W1N]|uniref:LysR family transcriptional regulator n=1 Tax=Microbacterium festucae TaxID=2977531 RepID=UPI0021C1DB5A|nr:LysR family transcriptional regulator [Microbacterium festucae]MCT9819840.1 LysR family transcriptional regulator [Microbacterium festucae]
MSPDRLTALLPHLPLLDALADDEHLTRAAERLGVPQPTVSRALKHLGEQLGVPVVERSGRGIRLTPAARRMLPAVRVALRAAHDALQSLDDARATVGVAFQNSLGERLVPALIAHLRDAGAGIAFSLMQGARDTCLAALDAGRVDLAIVSGAGLGLDADRARHLYEERLVVAVPTGHPLTALPRVGLRDLVDEAQVTLKPGYGLRQTVERLFATEGAAPRIAFEGDDLRTLHGLVAAGLGVAIGPPVRLPIEGCVQLEIDDPRAVRDMGVVVRAGARAPAVDTVVRALVEITDGADPAVFALS